MPGATAVNPILRGFHPDPSLLRVGDDYYIATSTFEWFPGVLVYHSRDLARWTLQGAPLDRTSLLDLRGCPDSGGVWAPCLSHDGKLFHLVYTVVRRKEGSFKDTPNFLTSSPSIEGPWSPPVPLNASGFDPSLFHDADGRKWLLNMVWDHRRHPSRVDGDATVRFAGIDLQEYDPGQRTLVGEPRRIFHRGPRGYTEGPHLYRRGSWYYLLVAEGGTGLGHAALFARSRRIEGPYVPDPHGYVLTANPAQSPLLRAGHASIASTPDGRWFLAHLCSRPLPGRGRSVMGRETALQALEWPEDGWPRLAGGGSEPKIRVETGQIGLAEAHVPIEEYLNFESGALPPLHYQTPRQARNETFISIRERPGYLRLKGRESLGSTFEQTLVARRQQAFRYRAETEVEFEPRSFQQMAGLVCYYDRTKHIYLHITSADGSRVLDLLMAEADQEVHYPIPRAITLSPSDSISLRADVDYDVVRLFFRDGVRPWSFVAELDYSILSDEVGSGGSGAHFTGAFVGIACQDLTGQSRAADFSRFSYVEKAEDHI